MESVYTAIAESFELLGTLTMVVGFIIAATLAVRALLRNEGGSQAFSTLRITLGSAILLGLEILVAADLVRTITSKPSIEEAVILGLIVLIRTVLSWSIQIEIEGVLPWRRALVESGASVLAKQIKQDHAKSAAYRQQDAAGSDSSKTQTATVRAGTRGSLAAEGAAESADTPLNTLDSLADLDNPSI